MSRYRVGAERESYALVPETCKTPVPALREALIDAIARALEAEAKLEEEEGALQASLLGAGG